MIFTFLLLYRSEKDRETILYTDDVRKLRQREYDNANLYSNTETPPQLTFLFSKPH
jgi:hypothetical protein